MLENKTQYRFRPYSASHSQVPTGGGSVNKNADIMSAFLHSMFRQSAGQFSSSSSVQLRFTCSLQLR